MNDYYSASTETQNTRARSSSVNSERAAVEAAFDKLPALLALLQDRVTYAADTGSANSYAAALANAPPAYVSGLHVVMTPANSCTGASTLNVNGLGARAIKRVDGTDPEAGDIRAGIPCEFVLVGSTFYLISAAPADVVGAVQSSATDATAGRLLKLASGGNGSFGLGGMTPVIGNASVTDGSIATGFYTYDEALGSSGGPTTNRGQIIHMRRAAAGGEIQFFLSEAGALECYVRYRVTSTWSSWMPTTPTAISGTTGGNSWSGYQIGKRVDLTITVDDSATAWGTAEGSFFRRASLLTVTFPYTFSAAPTVTPATQHGADRITGAAIRSVPTTTNVGLLPWSSQNINAGLGKTVYVNVKGTIA